MSAKQAVTQKQNELHKRILAALIKQEENRICADCTARGPTWASINLGVFICLNCSGIHRNLGVHISKVRSTNLDTWLPEQVEFVKATGNMRANHYWEAKMPAGYPKPQEQSDMATRKQFIEAKYVHKKFAGDGEPPSIEAYVASLASAPAHPPPAVLPATPAPTAEPTPAHSHTASSASSVPPAPAMGDLLGLAADSEFEDFKGVQHLSAASSAQASVAGTSTSALQLEDDDWGDFAAAPSASVPPQPAQRDPFTDLLGADFSSQAFGAPAEDPLASLMLSLSVAPQQPVQPAAPAAFSSAFPPAQPAQQPAADQQASSDPFADLLGGAK